MKERSLKILTLIFFLSFPFIIHSATITSATICVNGDDATEIWVNGNSMGNFAYVNWDSASPVPCMSVPVGYLNAVGTNVIASKVKDSAGGEIWSSWTMDVTYSDGTHAYVSSNDGGIKLSSVTTCTDPPADGGSLPWYHSSYALHSSWGNAVAVTGTIWGKTMYDIGTGSRVGAWSYSTTASASGHACMFMRQGVTLVPEVPPPPPNFTITKSSSKTTDIISEDLTFTLNLCNTGGYTTSRVYVTDTWSTNEFGYSSQNSSNNSNSAYGPNFSGAGQTVTIDFPGGFEGGSISTPRCRSFWFVLKDYYFDANAENCQVRYNDALVNWTGGSDAAPRVNLAMRCVSPTFTATRTRTSTMTFTRTPSPSSTRTPTPSPSNTYTRTMTLTPLSTMTFTPTRTSTPSFTVTVTSSPTRTASPTFTRTPSPSPSLTFTPSRTASPSPSPTPSPSPSPTFTRTRTVSPTYTWSPSPSATITYTPSRTVTATYTMTSSVTFTRTATPSVTITSMNTATVTPTRTPTFTMTPTFTATPSPTNTRTVTLTFTHSFTATNTFTRTVTPTITITTMNTSTSTPTRTNTSTYTPSFTVTLTSSSTSTRTITPSITITTMDTSTATPTFTPTFTASPTRTATRTYTETATFTPSFTASSTRTVTPTVTITSLNTATVTNTITPTYTDTRTYTPTFTSTSTPSASNTSTYTATVPNPPTQTATPTASPTFTDTRTYTPTSTYTATGTDTFTRTSTPTATETSTDMPTGTATFTATFTRTQTATPTATNTATETNTYTVTPTNTPVSTNTHTLTSTLTWTSTITPTYTCTSTPMGTPALLDIELTNRGDNPGPGAILTYKIKLSNNDITSAYNLRVWDTLPDELEYVSTTSPGAVTVTGKYIVWELPAGFVLAPGEETYIVFTARIIYIQEGSLVINTASADYNDGYHNTPDFRHPAITSAQSFYPEGQIIVFPNPFNAASAIGGTLKFANMVPGALLQIYTLSGEIVFTVDIGHNVKYFWNVKNRYGKDVSQGIYYWVVKNPVNGRTDTGKLFIVK